MTLCSKKEIYVLFTFAMGGAIFFRRGSLSIAIFWPKKRRM